MNGKLLSLIVSGLPLLAFGIVWVIFVNPRIERVPETYSSEIVFQGQYHMVPLSKEEQITTLRIDANTNTKSIENARIHLVENISSPAMELTIPSLKLPAYSIEFIADRRTRDYVDIDGRSIEGKFAFPVNLEENSSYHIWNNLSEAVIHYKFIRINKVYGINTYEFHGYIAQLPKKKYPFTPPSILAKTLWPGIKDYQNQQNTILDYSVEIYVEPTSGIVIDRTDTATLSYIDGDKSPIFMSTIKFTEQTRLDNINKAKERKRQLTIYGFYSPYAMIILGILLVVASIGFYLKILSLRYKARKTRKSNTKRYN